MLQPCWLGAAIASEQAAGPLGRAACGAWQISLSVMLPQQSSYLSTGAANMVTHMDAAAILLGVSYCPQDLPQGMEQGRRRFPSSGSRATLLLNLNKDCPRRSHRDQSSQPSEQPDKAALRESDAAMAVIFIRVCIMMMN